MSPLLGPKPRLSFSAAVLLLLSSAALGSGCDSSGGVSSSSVPGSALPSGAVKASPAVEQARHPDAPRIIAIGDVHGDLSATRAALRLASAIDESDRWVGGQLVVVQTGDQLDRGDEEQAIVELFDRLIDEAKKAGGAVYVLNGNHEIMNVAQDFRYVTEGGFKDFTDVSGLPVSDARVGNMPSSKRPRGAAFLPGAPFAKMLGRRDVVAVVGGTVFVHGGLLPAHISYGVDRINRETKAWMNGEMKSPPAIVTGEDAPVWARTYSEDPVDQRECAILEKVLSAIPAKRMVVGHTVQKGGVTSACDGKVWRIDVGLAANYGGPTEVLEIKGDDVRVLRPGMAGTAAPLAPSSIPSAPLAPSAEPSSSSSASAATSAAPSASPTAKAKDSRKAPSPGPRPPPVSR